MASFSCKAIGGDPIAPLDAAALAAARRGGGAVIARSSCSAPAPRPWSRRGAMAAGGDALPRAADARLLPPALRSLPPRPIYGRAPDAKPMR